MAWFRKARPGSGRVITPEGLPVTAKASPMRKDGVLATFEGMDQPWQWDRRVIVPDPGIPLLDYANDPLSFWGSQPSVRKVVDFRARNLASIPLHLYRRVSDTDRQRVTDHPLAKLLAAPGPGLTPFRLWHSVFVDNDLFDRWCVRVVESADTESGWELLRIPAPRMRLVADGWGRVAQVIVQTMDGQQVSGPPRGYVFDHGYASHGQVNGTSPLRTLQDILAEGSEAVSYRRSIWRNGARVPVVIQRPADAKWAPGARDRFVESMRRFLRGGGQEGGAPLLEDGMSMVKVDAFSPRDTGDIEGRQLNDAEVASAYHIAPELVGARPGNYSNIDAFRQMLYRDSLGADIAAWEQTLNAFLLPLLAAGDPDLYIEAAVEAKLRGSFEEEAAVLQSSVGAPWLTRNEARARRNLPAVEGGDELVTPLNVVTGGLASPRDTAPDPGASLPKARRPQAKSGRPKDLGTFERERDRFTDALTTWAQKQAETLLSAADAKADGPPDFYQLWAASSPERQAQLAALIQSWGFRLAQIGAWSVLGVWNPDAGGWDAAVMENWLAAAAKSHAEQYEQAGHQAIVTAIADEGDWRDNLAQGMSAWVSAGATRAVTAATEARGFGSHDAAGASGLEVKRWNTGSNPRADHAHMDGESVDLDALFSNGLRWPGDGLGAAAETAGCNCHLTYDRKG
ncbi:phage portal protein [Streptomyces tremellae]|uniref:Phage portal protein n=1 Tax=Streptomyces tremellae TaxID=1124239 RepID=A0ABP7EZ14_9ACTN